MGLESTLALMAAAMLGSSKGVSNMDSDSTISDPKRHNSPTGSPCAVDHTKVSNAVQDAHSAAEKAYNMAKVDGGVNKVVAVANKAANTARVAAVKAVQNRMHHK
ncbi:hypothetical protein GmHk_05G012611 [Glycine max]|nr:hypothetical protein GmHk_05G012611 [Glycine max]